jgi:hypothetical protein
MSVLASRIILHFILKPRFTIVTRKVCLKIMCMSILMKIRVKLLRHRNGVVSNYIKEELMFFIKRIRRTHFLALKAFQCH